MRSEGFAVLRQQGKHRIWTDGLIRMATPSSPSDCGRLLLNLKRDVRRRRREMSGENSTAPASSRQ